MTNLGVPDPADHDDLIPQVKKSMGHRAQGVKPHSRLDKKSMPSMSGKGFKGPMAQTVSAFTKG